MAVQQSDRIGTLEVGKTADLLVVDTLRAHLVPAGGFISALVHSGHPGDIESVMVDGDWPHGTSPVRPVQKQLVADGVKT